MSTLATRRSIRTKHSLLSGCAVASALAVLGYGQSAQAQLSSEHSFQGTATVVSGTASVTQSGIQDIVTVATPTTVIDWSPFDTASGGPAINFLPAGRFGLFSNDGNTPTAGGYTVLNRIVPSDATRAIRFNGTVESIVKTTPFDNGTRGGAIWFYSPGGIIAGTGSVFDVGSLVLTTADPFTTGNLLTNLPASETIKFVGALGSTATVEIQSGATITATRENSYVAIVAPTIVQAGTVTVNGSAAYIAAESVDVRIRNGLFDIEYAVGRTGGGTAISHTGTTTGPAPSVSVTDNHRTYFAALPKNDAITLLVGGTVGYTAAGVASLDSRGRVVLAAGTPVRDRGIGIGSASSAAKTNVEIGTAASGNVVALSSVLGNATGDVTISPASGIDRFDRDLAVSGGGRVELLAEDGEQVTVGGSLTLTATNLFEGSGAFVTASNSAANPAPGGILQVAQGLNINGFSSTVAPFRTGVASLTVSGGTVTAGGNASLFAADILALGVGTGGTATFDQSGGTFSAANVFLNAAGSGEDFFDGEALGAQGGTARATISGGSFTTPGLVQINATALSERGATGRGGAASLAVTGGTVSLGSLSLLSNASVSAGEGFFFDEPPPGTTGGLTGGSSTLSVANTTLNISGALTLSADADTEGLFASPGDVRGGTASVQVTNGGLNAANVTLSATAFATTPGDATVFPGAFGGSASIVADNSFVNANDLIARANATGGAGGTAAGGTARVAIDDSSASFRTISLDASAQGRDGDDATISSPADPGGIVSGGTAEVSVASGSLSLAGLSLTATAGGSDGGDGDAEFDEENGANGGAATGGLARVNIEAGSSLTIETGAGFGAPSLTLNANAFGGDGGNADTPGIAGNGASGTGGTAEFNLAGSLVLGDGVLPPNITLTSEGFGGDGGDVRTSGAPGGTAGAGGFGRGGTTLFFAGQDDLTLNSLFLSSSGFGDDAGFVFGGTSGAGGGASGGTARATIDTDPAIAFIGIYANAQAEDGGTGTDGGAGGAAINTGIAELNLTFGDLTATNVEITANALGGEGGFADGSPSGVPGIGGRGGDSTAGTARILVDGDSSNLDITGSLLLEATGEGGEGGFGEIGIAPGRGGHGGTGTGGTANITVRNDGVATIVPFQITADGRGGEAEDGANGGNGAGGVASLVIDGGSLSTPTFTLSAIGIGESGSSGNRGATGAAGTAGAAGTPGVIGVSGGNGGNGGAGGAGGAGGTGGAGGNGGEARGGTTSISMTGGTLTTGDIIANSFGFGGDGGFGGTGGAGGSGGAGGIGGAGASSFDFGVNGGNGGNGGAGGNGGVGGKGGTNGTAGSGIGGTVDISLTGGTIDAQNLTANANGTSGESGSPGNGGAGGIAGLGGAGGPRGESGYGTPGLPGSAGPAGTAGAFGSFGDFVGFFIDGAGGTIALSAGNSGEPGGLFDFDFVSLTANAIGPFFLAGPGGDILVSNIADAGTPATLAMLGLTATAQGSFDGNITIEARDATVGVDGNAFLTATQDIYVEGGGTGVFEVSNSLIGNANTNNILITHDARPGDGDTIRAASINLTAGFDLTADIGSRLQSEFIINLTAGRNVTLQDATTNEPGEFTIRAGFFETGYGSGSYNLGTALITGDVNAAGSLDITAGDDIVFTSTANVRSDNAIRLSSGDDIRFDVDASLVAGIDPTDSGYGSIADLIADVGVIDAIFEDPANIASFIAGAANIASDNGAILITAEAISASDASFAANDFTATIRNAPAVGVAPGTDGGQLSGDCVEGNICVGNIEAVTSILLGPATGTALLPNRVSIFGDLSANDITIRARDSIALGEGVVSGEVVDIDAITARNSLFVSSVQGDIIFSETLSLTGNNLKLFALGSITGGGGAIDGQSVGLGASDIDIGSITSVNSLDTIDDEGNVTTAGQLVVPNLARIGELTVTAGDAILRAGGIDIGAITASRDISVTTGGAAILNTVEAIRNVAISADGAISVNDLRAGGTVDAAGASLTIAGGGDLTFTRADAAEGDVAITTAGLLSVASSVAANDARFTTTGGGNLTLDSVDAGDDILISSAGNATLGTLVTRGAAIDGLDPEPDGSNIGVTAASDISYTTLNAINTLTLTAGGSITGDSLTAGNSLTFLAGDTSTLGALTAGGQLDGRTTAGNLTTGNVVGGFGVELASAGALTTGNVSATAGDVELAAANALTSGNIGAAAGSISLTNGAAPLTTGTLLARNDFTLDTGSSITFAGISVGDDINIMADGDASIGALVTTGLGTDAEMNRGNVTLAIGGALTTTTIDSHGGIVANATGAIASGRLEADTRIAIRSSGGAVTLADVESLGGAVAITANGAMQVGNVRAAGSINLTGTAAIDAGNLTAGTGPLIAGGDFGGDGGTDGAPAGIAPGFDDVAFFRNDDSATGAIALPFNLNFFGVNRSQTFVSNNGYLTFNSGQGTFTPSGLGAGYRGQPIIAAFFADVDTRNPASAQVTYGPGEFAGRTAFGATYQNVGYFPSAADKLNSFQIVLTDRADTGAGNFDIYYNYTRILWETGSASGGSNGFGGTSAAVGFNAGTGNAPGTFFELPGSRVPGSFLDSGPMPLITGTNNGTPGQLLFMVRNGLVSVGSAEASGVRVTNIATGNSATVRVGNVSGEFADIRGAGAVTLGNSDVGDRGSGITSANRLTTNLDAATTLTAGNVTSAGSATLRAGGGGIAAGAISTGNDLIGNATGAFNASLVRATGALDGSSRATISADSGITVPTIDVLGPVTLTATNGDILVATDLRASGTYILRGRANTATALDALTIGDAVASAGNLSLSVRNLLTINGFANGTQIALSSGNIAIATGSEGATVGEQGRTTSLRLTKSGNGVTTIGGGGVSGGYSLSNAEAQRLFAGDVIIVAGRASAASTETITGTALNDRAPDVVLDALTLTGASGRTGATAGNIGASGRLRIETAGKLRTVGAVALSNLGTGNRFEIAAAEAIEIDAATGSISLRDASSGLAGTLALTSEDIIAASLTAMADVRTAVDIAAIDTRLGVNDGETNDDGYLRADAITVNVSNGFYVQNSGAAATGTETSLGTSDLDARRGLTVGSGGLQITVGTGSPNARIVINGRQVSATATSGFLTGLDFLDVVQINGLSRGAGTLNSGLFDAGSTVNGCQILSSTSCQFVIDTGNDARNIIDAIEEGLEGEGDPLPFALIEIRDVEELGFPPVIDDPVTGSGNDDLYAIDDEQCAEGDTECAKDQ